jgi:hypothetical protein
MARELAMTHPSGLRRRAFLGFSWTSLFFGPVPAAIRGDWLGFGAYVLLFVVVGTVTAGFAVPVVWIAWAVFYNRWHARRLVEQGYAITGGAMPLERARARVLG